MITLKMAYRNIFRQKRRTLLTALTMLGGFVLASISIAWSDGAYRTVIDLFTRNQFGHIQIHGKGYLDKPSLYNTIDAYQQVGVALDTIRGVQHWAPRIYAAGLASVGEKSTGIRIVGVDPQRETATTRFDRKLSGGRMFDESGLREAILGDELARTLGAQVGDSVAIVSQGADGSLANDLYQIVGLAKTEDAIQDRTTVFLTLAAAQQLLVLEGRVHELAIVIDDLDAVAMMAQRIAERIGRPELSVEPWQQFAHEFYRAMQADRQGTWVSLFVVTLIVAVGVLNTVLMTVLERTREFGVLRAIGARPAWVSRMVLAEIAVMAGLSVLVGAVVALGCNYLLTVKGINIGDFTYGGVRFSTMYAEINLRSYLIPALTVMLSALIVSIFPAVRAARIAPARAMRMH